MPPVVGLSQAPSKVCCILGTYSKAFQPYDFKNRIHTLVAFVGDSVHLVSKISLRSYMYPNGSTECVRIAS